MDVLRRKLRQSPAYAIAREVHLHLRGLRAPDRALPDFLIIGAHKGGTSSFYQNLVTHPMVYPALTKEVHYFDRRPRPTTRWYRAHFPSSSEMMTQGAICGEATPSYALLPDVPRTVRELMPNVRLIFLLRDPVKRAYSAYQFNRRRGGIDLSFEDWIERDFRMLGERPVDIGALEEWLGGASGIDTVPVALLRGVYIEQIKNWLRSFPTEQVTVIDSADYFQDSPKVLNEISTKFLGLPEHQFSYQKTHHEKRSYPQMNDATRVRLEAFYAPYNEALYAYLGRDFGW